MRLRNGGILALHRFLIICHRTRAVRKVVVSIRATTAVDEKWTIDWNDLHKLLEVMDGSRYQRFHIRDCLRRQSVAVDEKRIVEWSDTDRFVGGELQEVPFVFICIAIHRVADIGRVQGMVFVLDKLLHHVVDQFVMNTVM